MNELMLNNSENKLISLTDINCKIISQKELAISLAGSNGVKLIETKHSSDEYGCEIFDISTEHNLAKADKLDIQVAIVSGVLSGLVDSFFVGKFSLDKANEWGDKKVEEFVIHIAKKKGCKGDDIFDAIKFLEEAFPIASDNLKDSFGGGRWHHLKDFSHHFSLLGLVFSIISQFTGKAYGVDINGGFISVDIQSTELIGKNFYEKIAFGSINWFYHMVSDMAGSSSCPGKGTGIPGPIVSMIRQCSAIPLFKKIKPDQMAEVNKWINHLFFGATIGDKDENGKIINPRKFDFRTEMGVLGEIGKQTIPVIMNECIVSAFYFARRLMNEIKVCKVKSIRDLVKIDPADVLPTGTPAIRNMRTVSRGVFVAVDMTDAAIRSGIECGGINHQFAVDFLLHVNVVGVGMFAVALGSELSAIREEAKKQKENHSKELEKFEKALAGFECISLSNEQTNILYSMQKISIELDIANEKQTRNIERKLDWLKNWLELIKKNNNSIQFMLEEDIIKIANNPSRQSLLDLVFIHYLSFAPYCPIGNERDKEYTKLKMRVDYLDDYFCNRQMYFTNKDLLVLKKAYDKTYEYINGSTKKKSIGAIATVATVGVTGAASFIFAPVIAPVAAGVLFSSTVSGLSGAALVNASLAAFGGGALAAGGAGMAGGALVIAGGGAAAGAIGATGANSMITFMTKASEALVLNKTVRTVVFCQEVIDKRLHDRNQIKNILESFENQLEQLLSLKKQLSDSLKDADDKKLIKSELKILEKNINTVTLGKNLLVKILPKKSKVKKN